MTPVDPWDDRRGKRRGRGREEDFRPKESFRETPGALNSDGVKEK